jgi:hypothetical protein
MMEQTKKFSIQLDKNNMELGQIGSLAKATHERMNKVDLQIIDLEATKLN